MKHTKGPWKWEFLGSKAVDGTGLQRHEVALNADDDEGIMYHSAYWEVEEANAKVIAAAPDLLEALKESIKVMQAVIDDTAYTDAVEIVDIVELKTSIGWALKAIKKAEG